MESDVIDKIVNIHNTQHTKTKREKEKEKSNRIRYSSNLELEHFELDGGLNCDKFNS